MDHLEKMAYVKEAKSYENHDVDDNWNNSQDDLKNNQVQQHAGNRKVIYLCYVSFTVFFLPRSSWPVQNNSKHAYHSRKFYEDIKFASLPKMPMKTKRFTLHLETHLILHYIRMQCNVWLGGVPSFFYLHQSVFTTMSFLECIAQLVQNWAFNLMVIGSSPAIPKPTLLYTISKDA